MSYSDYELYLTPEELDEKDYKKYLYRPEELGRRQGYNFGKRRTHTHTKFGASISAYNVCRLMELERPKRLEVLDEKLYNVTNQKFRPNLILFGCGVVLIIVGFWGGSGLLFGSAGNSHDDDNGGAVSGPTMWRQYHYWLFCLYQTLRFVMTVVGMILIIYFGHLTYLATIECWKLLWQKRFVEGYTEAMHKVAKSEIEIRQFYGDYDQWLEFNNAEFQKYLAGPGKNGTLDDHWKKLLYR